MRDTMRRRSNTVIVVFVFVTLLLAAAIAVGMVPPSSGVMDGQNKPKTLVGSQGQKDQVYTHGSVFLLDGKRVAWRQLDPNGTYFGATRLRNGSVVVGFASSGYDRCGRYESPCNRTGFRIIDPKPTPHIVYEYSFPVRTATNSEVHDVQPLSNGRFLLTDMDRERIMIVKHKQVVWQWRASSVYDPPADPTTADWLHINDVDRIGPGKYLVSVRNKNQLLVIQRQQRGGKVVEVINRDPSAKDGIGVGNGSLFGGQHNPQWLDSNAILVADSGHDRVVEIHKNPRTGQWHVAWSLDSADGVAFDWPRDADRLPNGNTLITDSLNRRIVAVDRSGTVVWRVNTSRVPYEADRLPYGERVGAPRYDQTNQSRLHPARFRRSHRDTSVRR